jgi:DNA polymerase-1
MRWLSTCDRIAFDVETSGLDVNRDNVRLVQVGDAVHGWAVPWQQWGGVIVDLVNRFEGEYVMHNASFDWAMMHNRCGITLPRHRVHDTRVMSHILRPDLSTALKNIATRLVDPAAARLQSSLDEALKAAGWTWATVPIDFQPYWSYACLDTVLTFQLDDLIRPQVMAEAPKAYDLEMAVIWVAAVDMSRRGIRVDRAYTEEHLAKFMRYVEQVEKWCVDSYGVKPGQNAAVVKVLMEAGFEFTRVSEKTGAETLDADVLLRIDHPLAQAVLARRRVQKVATTYLKNFLALADDDDILHPRINTLGFKQDDSRDGLGVRTGRMSMSDPNLQNLTRRTDEPSAGNTVRNCLTSREGHTLLMIDFAQIEARLIAHLTEDPGFIDAFSQGDFFTNITREMWNDPTIPKSDPRRQSTKNAIYARAYGAGIPKFATTAGIEIEQARALYERLDQLYPGWQTFTRKVETTARSRLDNDGTAYVSSFVSGRRHVAPEGKIYVLVNYLVQGTAAEIFKMKLVELAHAGLDEYMCVPVHDEIVMDVPNDRFEEVLQTAMPIMNDSTLLRVPIEAEASRGKRWGEKHSA